MPECSDALLPDNRKQDRSGLAGSSGTRHILLHIHLFKNSGSSIDHLLAESFGKRWGTVEGTQPSSVVHQEQIETHLRAHPELLALSSHQVRPPLLEVSDLVLHPIVILRHPLDRMASVYAHSKRGNRPHSDLPFPDYVRFRLGPGSGPVMRNFHVASLSNALGTLDDVREVKIEAIHLAEAKAFLDALPAFGLVERFNDSLELLHNAYGAQFPELKLEPIHKNRSPRASTLEERMEKLRVDLGGELFAEVERANELDMELYRFGCELFERLWTERMVAPLKSSRAE